MLNGALRNLVAQIAFADKNAKEATEYGKPFKRSWEDFIRDGQANDDRFGERLVSETHCFNSLLLDGISFKDGRL